jgi:hypothetical protein
LNKNTENYHGCTQGGGGRGEGGGGCSLWFPSKYFKQLGHKNKSYKTQKYVNL